MIKKLFRQSSQYLIGNIAINAIGFISLPILTRLLPLAEYGLFSLVGASIFILVAISKFGLQHAAIRFYAVNKDNPHRLSTFYSTLFWSTLILAVLMSGSFLLLFKIFGKHFMSFMNSWLAFVVAGLVVTGAMIALIFTFMRLEQRVKQFNLILISHHYGGVFLGIIFLLFISKTSNWYFLAFLIAGVVISLIAIFLFIGKDMINPKFFSLSFFKGCLKFGFPLQFMEIGNLLIKFSDKYLLQIIIGISVVGVYAVGASLSVYLKELVFLPVTYAVFPLLMEIYEENGLAAAEKFISTVSNYVWIVAIPIIFGFSMIREDVVLTLASEKFIDTAAIIPIMTTGAFLRGFCQLYAAGLHISKMTKTYAIVVFIGVILNIILNIVLIPALSFKGAAIATLATYAILLGLVMKLSFVHLRVRIYPMRIAKSIFCSIIMCLIINVLDLDILIVRLISKILLGFFVYCTCLMVVDLEIRGSATRFLKSSFSPSFNRLNN